MSGDAGWRTRSRASAKRRASYAISALSRRGENRERRERRQLRSHRHQRQQQRCDQQPLPVQRADVAQPERDVRQQVEGGAAQHRDRRHQLQGLLHVSQGLLQAERQQHDAGDHREVEIRIGVARDLVSLPALGGARQPPRRHQRHHVEVQPPHGGRDDDAEHGRGDDTGVHAGLGTDADGHDGLAERDDHDQAVALGEVRRHQLPSLGAEEVRLGHVQHQGQSPQGALQRAVEEGCRDQEAHSDRRSPGEPDHRLPQPGIVAAGEHEERDLRPAHDPIGAREEQSLRVECLRHAQRRHEERRHRREHHQAHGALLRIHDAGQPRIAGPGPPQHAEDQQSLRQALPRRIAHHQRRALRQRQHEHQVEEQLEGGHVLLLAHHGCQPWPPAGRGGAHRGVG